MRPAIETVRRIFIYHPESGVLERIESSRRDMLGDTGRSLEVWIDGRKFVKTHVIWAVHFGYWPAQLIDHRDGDKSNTKLNNLREATHQQNQFNKVGFGKYPKGVVFKADAKRSKPWSARIRIDGKKIPIGSYATMEEAAAAYEAVANKYHGDFAVARR